MDFTVQQTETMHQTPPMKPQSWLWQSIVVTILCCLPFGIAGIVNASKVDSRYMAGDYAGAERAAKNARKWTIVGIVCGVIYLIVVGIYYFNMIKSGNLPAGFPDMDGTASPY